MDIVYLVLFVIVWLSTCSFALGCAHLRSSGRQS